VSESLNRVAFLPNTNANANTNTNASKKVGPFFASSQWLYNILAKKHDLIKT